MSWAVIYSVIGILLTFIIGFPIFILITREYFRRRKLRNKLNKELTIGFFHPYCNAGGGVERVLWSAIRAIQNKYPHVKVVLYTGDLNASPEEITNKVIQRFDIKLPQPVDFVYLYGRRWIEADTYPYFTMLGQSIGSIILGLEAMMAFLPDVYVDSMGYAFTLPLFSYIGLCSVLCYIHHPAITTDMLSRYSPSNSINYTNRRPILSTARLIYYRLFARVYACVGRFSDSVIVNSTWTEDHINSLWDCLLCSHRVYPPCDTESIKKLLRESDECNKKEIRIVTIGQFRAEKDHPLQLKTMYQLRQIVKEDIWDSIKLVVIGTCSSKEDKVRVKDMQDLCKHLSLENNVEFRINISYSDLKQELVKGLIGLHTMQNEHFGISVVECMAAGLIMVAHRSGGPKMDIIEEAEGSRTGYFATDETEFASTIASIIQMPEKNKEKIQEAARSSVDRFSIQEFESGFLRAVEPFLNTKKSKTEN